MMLAFLIDQIQELSCTLFQRCRRVSATYRNLWERMRALFQFFPLLDWERFYLILAKEKIFDTC